MSSSFPRTSLSLSASFWTRPMMSKRSTGSTAMPLASRIFSLYRTVLNAPGRAPIAQIGAERLALGTLGVLRGERVGNAVLRQHIADGHLAAERVAPEIDAHLRG